MLFAMLIRSEALFARCSSEFASLVPNSRFTSAIELFSPVFQRGSTSAQASSSSMARSKADSCIANEARFPRFSGISTWKMKARPMAIRAPSSTVFSFSARSVPFSRTCPPWQAATVTLLLSLFVKTQVFARTLR